MKNLLAALSLFVSIGAYAAPVYLLFDGIKHEKFLGCLNCNKYDNSSIWNKYGEFGSKYSNDSIWNKYGTYGSKYNSESPWNKYSTNAPIIVDKNGNFYGKFTANKYDNQTKIKELIWILENYEYILDNIDDVMEKM
ncbi:hypothetical protein N8E86_09840 [Avibacterium paragallinarum]|uniref:hypothetical protein n=1 Tax=Avibacterium paragallinarum TaxID=728 RepID=UPI0021F6CF6C|nr:hypothetical protein [Avibacterium paragallinarum]UXN34346.1 hypothetical protein N8E86_09840 [Avibacterium paragallinarum]